MNRRTLKLGTRTGGVVVVFSICFLMLNIGCKTSDDAAAAAQQMSDTAEALAGYYSALHRMLRDSDQLNSIQQVMLQIPYDDANRKQITDAEAAVGRRDELASGLSDLAGSFTSLTTPDAAKAASASAAGLQAELETIRQLEPASTAIDAMGAGMQTLVTAIQEHKEREAARAMASTVEALDALFTKEMPLYESLHSQYLGMAQSLAVILVDKQQIDESYFVADALGPFDLKPVVTDPGMRKSIDDLAKKQIVSSAAEQKMHYARASAGMEQALKEMVRRINLVAGDKPMTLRTAPASLLVARAWSQPSTAKK